MNKKIKISDINWDVDNKVDLKNLPTELTIFVTDIFLDENEFLSALENLDIYIGDYLSNTFGYCVSSFSFNF